MIDNRLSVHHIGGRDGNRAFPCLRKFEKDLVNVFYDADPDCLAQIQERNQNLESKLHVLPYCLADVCKSTSLNINYDPYTSSLLDPNPEYKSYYYFNLDHDYVLADVTKVIEKRRIEAVTIDYIFQAADIQIPRPDFLSIDTQGSEYEILVGAEDTLKSSVIALVVEAEFHPVYKGQKLFGELMKLLSDQGFHFVRFLGIQGMSSFRAPVGLRGEGLHVSTDALFFRRIDDVDNSQDELRRYVMLRKLAFVAVVFNQFEYGLECLRRSKDLVSHNSTIHEEEAVYLKFLRDLEQSAERMPTVYPHTFVSKYTSFTASKARFEGSPTNKTGMVNEARPHRRVKRLLKKVLDKIVFIRTRFLVHLSCSRYTDVETILIRYGLERQANVLKKNRLIQERFLRKS